MGQWRSCFTVHKCSTLLIEVGFQAKEERKGKKELAPHPELRDSTESRPPYEHTYVPIYLIWVLGIYPCT
jgi:hypothetical protein